VLIPSARSPFPILLAAALCFVAAFTPESRAEARSGEQPPSPTTPEEKDPPEEPIGYQALRTSAKEVLERLGRVLIST
jgi:hypothetical protein